MTNIQVYVLVYFIYGLAFVGLGIAMALEMGRSPAFMEARVLGPLAAFGLLHGSHEWLESYLLQAEWLGTNMPDWLPWLRLGILIASFCFLLVFSINLLRPRDSYEGKKNSAYYGIVLLYTFVIVGFVLTTYPDRPIPWLQFLDAASRYLLAVPASFLAGLALNSRGRRARAEGAYSLNRLFSIAVIGFFGYAVSQIFVQKLDMFPANLFNQANFLEFFGFPIQVVRTAAAVIIAYCLLRGAQLMEIDRNTQLITVQRARLEALQQRELLRRVLLRRCVKAQEEERARVARELHDETAQSLSAFSLELAALRPLLKRQRTALGKVDRLHELSRAITQGLYRLMSDLRPAQLDDLGLLPAIKFMLEQECNANGMDIHFGSKGSIRRLDPLLETVLFRVAQEALHNICHHAATRQGRLFMDFGEKEIELRIEDDGRGFDVTASFIAPRGWGLAGMRERVESVGGIFNIESAPGHGTTVTASIPLDGKPGGINGYDYPDAG